MLQNGEFIYLLFISGLFLSSHGSPEFHPINITKNYEDAKQYCRNTYADLATIHDLSEMNDLRALVLGGESGLDKAFIGLEIAETRKWHWAVPAHTLEYTNWREGSPKDKEYDSCGAIDESGKWFESNCTTKRGFVCHSSVGSPVLVTDTKTWRNAQNHCRSLSTDLVSIRSAEDNAIVANMSQNAWIGLFYDPWRWSDGSNSSFRNWINGQPNYLKGQDCGVAVLKNGKWNDLKCTGRRHFICQGAYKPPTTIATATEGATQVTYLSTKYNITSKSTIVTFHFTLQSNSSHSSTMASTTASTSPSTTAATTASTSPSTTAATTASTSPSTTAATTASISASTSASTSVSTSVSTSAATSAEPVSLVPHTSTPESLVLVQQNLTWAEAVSYCRTHHMDLVYISSEAVQRRVSEKLDLATSPHVWIGLKYICLSKTWFWIQPSGGCYQNWAPHQGSEGNYSCGVSGAIQSTGGQQWVGLPHTHKLNFICYGCTG